MLPIVSLIEGRPRLDEVLRQVIPPTKIRGTYGAERSDCFNPSWYAAAGQH